jgi:hypothetical protein
VAEFEFVPALPGTWTLAAQDLPTVNEEAAHAVVGALMGLEVLEVRTDSPDHGVAGHVLVSTDVGDISCDEDLQWADYKRLLTVLAGPVFARRWDTFRWPLDEHEPGDSGLVARYCRLLRYDWADLLMAERGVRTLLENQGVHEAVKAVGAELMDHGAIPGARVCELVAQAEVDPAVTDQALLPARRSEV